MDVRHDADQTSLRKFLIAQGFYLLFGNGVDRVRKNFCRVEFSVYLLHVKTS